MSKKKEKKHKKKKFFTKWKIMFYTLQGFAVVILVLGTLFYLEDKYDGKVDFIAEEITIKMDEHANAYMVVLINSDSLRTLRKQRKIREAIIPKIKYSRLYQGLDDKIFRGMNKVRYVDLKNGRTQIVFPVTPEIFKEKISKILLKSSETVSVFSNPSKHITLKDLLEDMVENPSKVKIVIDIDD